jgi:hypothetical protein
MDTSSATLRSRTEIIAANLDWLIDHGYTIHGETIVDPGGGGGFSVEYLSEPGFTPATQADQ